MNQRNPAPPLPPEDATVADTHATFRNITMWLKGLTALVIGSWILFGLYLWLRNDADGGYAGRVVDPTVGMPSAHSIHTPAGKAPWGRLTYFPITISPPLELVPETTPPASSEVQWHFPNTNSEQLHALLSEIGLSESLQEKLVSLAEMDAGIEGLTVRPTREIVLGLSPEDRSALYATLTDCPENLDQKAAFRFCGTSLDEWIGNSQLSPETRKLIEPLVYRHGSFLFFADLPSLEQSLPSPEQRSLLIEALSDESTFLMQLELSPQSDLERLVEYWGRGGRTKDVRPILESLLHTGGEQSIDVTHLLPPFARSRLYTYHVATEQESQDRYHCHWTSLNFFSEEPDDRFCDVKEAVRTMKEDYYHVYGSFRLGDVVAFFDSQERLLHSAVFVADDVLFTNNARGSSSPWILMKLDDMKSYFPSRKELQIICYRRKDL